jgi:hypothetical protein
VQEVGFPTRNEVEGGRRPVCTSAARKIGVPLAGARDGVPQQACFPWLCAERMNAFGEGVAGRNGPQRRVPEDGSSIAGWSREETSSLKTVSCMASQVISCCCEDCARYGIVRDCCPVE